MLTKRANFGKMRKSYLLRINILKGRSLIIALINFLNRSNMLNSLFGRVLILIAAVIFCLLQSKLWMGDGGFLDIQELKTQIATQQAENEKLAERNRILKAEVNDLKSGTEAIEEHARLDLGLVKTDETFILVTANKQANSAPVVNTPELTEGNTP